MNTKEHMSHNPKSRLYLSLFLPVATGVLLFFVLSGVIDINQSIVLAFSILLVLGTFVFVMNQWAIHKKPIGDLHESSFKNLKGTHKVV